MKCNRHPIVASRSHPPYLDSSATFSFSILPGNDTGKGPESAVFFFFAGRISYLTHEISSSDERASLFPAARPSPRELNSSPLAHTLLLAVAERSRAGWQKWTLGFGFSWKNKAVIVAWLFPRACPEAWLLVEGAELDGHIPRARDTLGGGGASAHLPSQSCLCPVRLSRFPERVFFPGCFGVFMGDGGHP